jgi:putative ABC transport system permease protein
MWMSVRERTKEIGTMRAIGAQRRFVLQILLYESMLLGLFASLIGVVVGAIIIAAINFWEPAITVEGVRLFLMANTLKFNLHFGQLIGTIILFAVITGLAALYPALKAAKLRPVEALMHTK